MFIHYIYVPHDNLYVCICLFVYVCGGVSVRACMHVRLRVFVRVPVCVYVCVKTGTSYKSIHIMFSNLPNLSQRIFGIGFSLESCTR